MIKLIGLKRVMALLVLVMLNAALALTFFMWIEPAKAKSENDLRALNGQIAKLRNDILNIKEEIKKTKENMPYFEAMDQLGFFSTQDRFMADELINKLGNDAGVESVTFTINPLEDLKDPRADKAKYRLISSKIDLSEIRGYTDSEIYKFIYAMNNSFPGHIRINEINIQKSAEVTSAALDKIKSGDPSARGFVSASAKLQWLTMIEDQSEKIPGAGR